MNTENSDDNLLKQVYDVLKEIVTYIMQKKTQVILFYLGYFLKDIF